MHSSNVVKALDGPKKVLDFVPPKIELKTPEQALEYLRAKKAGSEFKMNDTIRVQTGVDKIEATSFADEVELRTLERLKDVQEAAYQEAYQLGLNDGEKKAFREYSEMINARLGNFDQLLDSLGKMKTLLLHQNESQLVKLLLHMASRLAHGEIVLQPERITEIIRSAVEMTQVEENVLVRLSAQDFEFIEKLRKEGLKADDILHKVKIESDPTISVGGCVIETNYGIIDAQLESRVSQLWESVSEQLYKIKDKISAA